MSGKWQNFVGSFLVVAAIVAMSWPLFVSTVTKENSNVPIVNTAGVFGQQYFWADSIPTNTTGFDSTFTHKWQQITIYADTIALWVKIGAPDVNNWTSKKWFWIPAGGSAEFGPAAQITRMACKARTGSGIVYLVGYKSRREGS